MKKSIYLLATLLVVVVLAAACGGSGGASSQSGAQPTSSAGATGGTSTAGGAGASGGASAAAGDPKAGETLFASATIGTNPGCKTCHTLDGTKLVGPSLQGIASRAGTRVQGESAEQYIRTSISDPNAFVVPEYTQGVMPSYKTVVSDTQLNDLVAYLMTLK